MSDDMSLFGEPDQTPEEARATTDHRRVADWQVALLRKALDIQRLQTMSERKERVEAAVGRPVESLRDLTSEEANAVLMALQSPPSNSTGSSWDDRDEATWIDRL